MITINEYLEGLGEAIGQSGLAADEEGSATLSIDDKFNVTIRMEPQSDRLQLFADIGQVPETAAPDLTARLLHANCFWQETGGTTIGVDFGSRTVLLAFERSAQDLDSDEFNALLEGFINIAEHWQDDLAAVSEGGETGSDGADASDPGATRG